MSEYRDFGYTAPGPENGNVDRQLAERFVSLPRGLNGVQLVCDLGCGNGYLASRLGAFGLHVTGIDTSESGLDIARRHYATDKVTFVRAEIGADLEALLPAGLRFDVVVSSDVIEHLYRPAAVVETVAALLKPGGYLIVGTPYHGYLKNLAISVLNKWDSHHGVHWNGGYQVFQRANAAGPCCAARLPGGNVPLLWTAAVVVETHDLCSPKRVLSA